MTGGDGINQTIKPKPAKSRSSGKTTTDEARQKHGDREMSIEGQIAKTLNSEIGVEVEVTLYGVVNKVLSLTISGNQADAAKAAGFMVLKGLAVLTEAVSYIEDPEVAYYYLTA